jgi:TatD DNase family protein
VGLQGFQHHQEFSLLVDSHAHLDSPRYDEDRDQLLVRAWEAGVRAILTIGIGEGPETMHQALDLVRHYAGRPQTPRLYASAGIYPHESSQATPEALGKLDQLLCEPEVIACGEIGLDYFYVHSPHEEQKTVFRQQMEIAATRRKPILIHCRPSNDSANAWDDLLAMLEAHWRSTGLGGVLHCFGGAYQHACRAMDLGFLISFAGNMTFAKAQPIRDVAARLPLDSILVETDCPYLAPVPNRGKRNEPAWVVQVAETLATLHGTDADAIARQTTQNFNRFFTLP